MAENGYGNGKTTMWISIAAFTMTIVTVSVGATWVVGEIKGTTTLLGERIDRFGASVDKLSSTLEANTGRINGHELRIQRIEDRQPR